MPNIEYLPGLKAGGKIDLDNLPSRRFDKKKERRPESYLPLLEERLAAMSARLSAEYGGFFTESGQIEMAGVSSVDDQFVIDEKETLWAGEKRKDRETWRADRHRSAPQIAEMALTVLFDRLLGDDFIVVRASTYDDYKNGADQLIIDKHSGAVICGLDDVLGHIGDDGGRAKEKILADHMASGGATIKYGLASRDGRLERKTLRHIPLFFFSLSKQELDELLKCLESPTPALTDGAQTTFDKLVNSLDQQFGQYRLQADLPRALQDNLDNFGPSLKKMLNHVKTEQYADPVTI